MLEEEEEERPPVWSIRRTTREREARPPKHSARVPGCWLARAYRVLLLARAYRVLLFFFFQMLPNLSLVLW
eukprot:6220803-Prymnesium_polylepis.1